jgi:hypothetical protein
VAGVEPEKKRNKAYKRLLFEGWVDWRLRADLEEWEQLDDDVKALRTAQRKSMVPTSIRQGVRR